VPWNKGFNIRASIPFVTDGSDETYSLGGLYPETRNGVTFGFDTDETANTRNRNAGIDRRLAGTLPTSATVRFRVDLPALGYYWVGLAIGDDSNAEPTITVKLEDGVAIIATITGATGIGEFLDANETLFSAANWPGQNKMRLISMSGLILKVAFGFGASSGLAHLFLSQANPPYPFSTVSNAQSFRK
jgi:hypothetical protein